MELNDLRAWITIASFLSFIGIVVWAYRPRSQAGFDQAARSVLEEEDAGERK